MKTKIEGYDFSPETVESKRKFPILSTILLCILIAAQIACVLYIILYQPKPQDIIDNYTVYISPQEDGSLNIQYCFTWTALDPNEELTWVEVGMANEYFTILPERSDNVLLIRRYSDEEGYCYAQVYFDRPYRAGETLDFHFTVNQERVLSTNGAGVFYEFIPGWFNYSQIKQYSFHFEKYGDIASFNGDDQDTKWLTWTGSLDYGEYVCMRVNYNAFDAHAVHYQRFDGEGAQNGLASDKLGSTAFMVVLILVMLIIEVCIIDSFVSYNRGRGFLCGYGHPMHVYGHVNPNYTREAGKHRSSGGGGRGCACACACACAGGGRAGCSQKDTYHHKKHVSGE
jgi:hypothetical protein